MTKIFLLKKVRNIDDTFEDEMRKDLKAFTKTDVNFTMKRIKPDNEIELVFPIRYNKGAFNIGDIPEQAEWLITGECEDFQPKFGMGTLPHFPGYYCFHSIDEFYITYKKNAEFYGASDIKNMNIQFNPNRGMVVDIQF